MRRSLRARRSSRLGQSATTDALTGLGDRRGWQQVPTAEETRCRRYSHPACVLVVDLNALKTVNDTAGHATGDDQLRTAARVPSHASGARTTPPA